ncbi:cobQ/CobB/MinD/ParA nucleotide binding domain protein, partial [Chlamydia psittaci 84-8471/1]
FVTSSPKYPWSCSFLLELSW